MKRGFVTRLASIEEFAHYAITEQVLPYEEYINTAALPVFLKNALGLPEDCGEKLRLSAETLYQHSQKHKETSPAIYAHICPLMPLRGLWLRLPQSRNGIPQMRICAYMDYQEKIWKMGIKLTKRGETYISTLFRSNKKQCERDRKNGKIIE